MILVWNYELNSCGRVVGRAERIIGSQTAVERAERAEDVWDEEGGNERRTRDGRGRSQGALLTSVQSLPPIDFPSTVISGDRPNRSSASLLSPDNLEASCLVYYTTHEACSHFGNRKFVKATATAAAAAAAVDRTAQSKLIVRPSARASERQILRALRAGLDCCG